MSHGNSVFYWTPDDGGTLIRLDFGFGAGKIDDIPVKSTQLARTGTGGSEPHTQGGGWEFRITFEFGEDEDVFRETFALINHLQRGGVVAFSFDPTGTYDPSSRSYCAIANDGADVGQGDNGITMLPNSFVAYDGITEVAVGDELIIQSNLPELRFECVRAAGGTSPTFIALTAGVVQTYSAAPIIIRSRFFFPFIRLAPGEHERQLITHDAGMNPVFSAIFIEDTRLLHRIDEGEQDQVVGTSDDVFHPGGGWPGLGG